MEFEISKIRKIFFRFLFYFVPVLIRSVLEPTNTAKHHVFNTRWCREHHSKPYVSVLTRKCAIFRKVAFKWCGSTLLGQIRSAIVLWHQNESFGHFFWSKDFFLGLLDERFG